MNETTMNGKEMEEAGQIIRDGGLVAFPTETVYGLGADALNAEASGRIYAAKGRPSDNPLIVHIASLEALAKIVKEIPPEALALAKAFWPGPLTMIFEKSSIVPLETTGGLETVAVRMPNHPVALRLIESSTGYIAAPSANTSGRPSPTCAEHVLEDMDDKIPMILDGGPVEIGIESTIVDLTGTRPMILRPGYITEQMMEQVLHEQVLWDPAICGTEVKGHPKAPGMKYRHYAPKADLTIIAGSPDRVVVYINQQIEENRKKGLRTGVLCTEESRGMYEGALIKSIGTREEEETIARHLFAGLRDFDDVKVDVIYSESFASEGLGQAVMNRLIKAAGHHLIEV